MAFNVNDKTDNRVEYDLIPEGPTAARCVRIVELGEQDTPYGKKEQVVLYFTVPNYTIEIDGEKKQRVLMTWPINISSNPDSNLMGYMKAFGAVDWDTALDSPCMLNIEHKEVTKNGKTETKVNIKGASKVGSVNPYTGEPFTVPEADCDKFIFDFQNPDKEVWEKLGEYRQGQIKSATNYEGSAVEEMLEGRTEATNTGGDAGESDDSPI